VRGERASEENILSLKEGGGRRLSAEKKKLVSLPEGEAMPKFNKG